MAEMMRLEQELLAVQHRMNQQQMQVFQQIQNMTAAQRYGNGGFGGIQNLIHGLTGGPTNMLGGNIPGLDPFSVLGGGGGFGGMDFTSFLGGGGFDIFGNLGIGSFLGGGFGFGFC
ncbi:OLC1v1001664C2 [Oldenlandia corymbosa var. corymbosa]|nr:OLC1v1001664C2 [Oldenlandia corymbosa var. corymbosa]